MAIGSYGNISNGTILGATDNTPIGNIGDELKVTSSITSLPVITREDVNTTEIISGNSTSFDSSSFGCLSYQVEITSVSGTNPTIQIGVEISDDNSNWTEFTNTIRFTSMHVFRHQRLALGGRYYRFNWIISGSSPSFTFNIKTTLKSYLPKRNVSFTKYNDIDITTVGAVSTTFQAADCQNVTIVSERGSGTGNISYRVQGGNNNINFYDLTVNIIQGPNSVQVTLFSNQSFRFYRLIITVAGSSGNLDLYWGGN